MSQLTSTVLREESKTLERLPEEVVSEGVKR